MPKRAGQTTRSSWSLSRGLLVVFLMVLAGTWLWWLGRSDLMINSVVIIAPEAEDVVYVKRYITNKMAEPLLFGLTQRGHRSLLKRERLSKNLTRLFPVFKNARASVVGQEITVELEPRMPHALWCAEVFTPHERCWFVDDEYIMYREAPSFSDGVYIKYSSSIHDTPGIGGAILDDSLRILTSRTVQIFEDSELGPTRIHAETSQRTVVYIQSLNSQKLTANARIIISPDQTIEEIQARLTLLLGTPEFIAEVTSYPRAFLYADLRFPGRLVYKMNDELISSDK